jgi:phosphoenolpyruvate carboxylase
LIEQEGRRLFEMEEQIRLLCKRLRFDYDPGLDKRLLTLIDGFGPDDLERIVRAFSVYFQLINIAERYHRVRRRRQYESSPDNSPQRASVASALSRLKGEGMEPGRLQEVLDRLSVRLVLGYFRGRICPTESRATWRKSPGRCWTLSIGFAWPGTSSRRRRWRRSC